MSGKKDEAQNGNKKSKEPHPAGDSDEDEVYDEASTSQADGRKSMRATDSVGNKDKKGKTLRFNLPEASDAAAEQTQSDHRSYQEYEIQNVMGFRGPPLPFPRSNQISDIMRAMHADISEDDSASSVYWDAEYQVSQPSHSTAYAYKPLFDALRRSPTKSQADYHLLMAAHLRNLGGVKRALENGANINVVQDRQTALIIATENNDRPLVRYLVTVKNINLDYQNIYGSTALLIALRSGFDEIATLLVKRKAKLNIVNNFGRTPIHEALFRENIEMVKLLIEYHHELESTDVFGEKPMYTCSVKKPNLKIMESLLNAGASCEYANETGLSLLSRAILNSTSFPVVKRLVVAGADVNHQDRFCKRTPLHMAAIIDSWNIAKLLVQHGANPDLRTIGGLTAFDLAVYYRSFDTAEYLAVYTKNAALNMENFKDSLLSRLPNNKSALFFLRTNTGLPAAQGKNSYFEN